MYQLIISLIIIPLIILLISLIYDRVKIKSYKLQFVPILLFSILTSMYLYNNLSFDNSLLFKNIYIAYALIALALLTYIYLQIKTFSFKNNFLKTLSIFTILVSLGLSGLFSADYYQKTYKNQHEYKTYNDNFVCYEVTWMAPVSISVSLYKPIPFSSFPLLLKKISTRIIEEGARSYTNESASDGCNSLHSTR